MEKMCFNTVFNYLYESLPDNWDRVVFYAMLSEGRYTMKYFVDFGDGKMIDCFTLKNISKSSLFKVFSDIYNVLKEQIENLPQKEQWSSFIMQINGDGSFNANFDYEDISNSFVEKTKDIEKRIRQNMIGVE